MGAIIPIVQARRIAEDFGYDQVVIFAADRAAAKNHVTTWGKTREHCDEAAQVGAIIARTFGDQSLKQLRELFDLLILEIDRKEAEEAGQ